MSYSGLASFKRAIDENHSSPEKRKRMLEHSTRMVNNFAYLWGANRLRPPIVLTDEARDVKEEAETQVT